MRTGGYGGPVGFLVKKYTCPVIFLGCPGRPGLVFVGPCCVSQSPCCLILVDLLHNLRQSWSPCDKPTHVSEMQDLQVDRSLIYAGDKGC